MFGEIEPLKALHDPKQMEDVIERILKIYPTHLLDAHHPFYRVRTNPTVPNDFSQYDSPPDSLLGNNRFDDKKLPILYGSPDLDLCIHECRVSVEDELYVAKLMPTQNLKVLNLAVLVREEKGTEFTSLDLAIHFLFLAGRHSYEICRYIAKAVHARGFDGLIYPSYFSCIRTGATPFETILGMSIRQLPPLESYVQTQSVPNLALFGRPIRDEKVSVHSINKVLINSIKYEMSFGPILKEQLVNRKSKKDFLKTTVEKYLQGISEMFSKSN